MTDSDSYIVIVKVNTLVACNYHQYWIDLLRRNHSKIYNVNLLLCHKPTEVLLKRVNIESR